MPSMPFRRSALAVAALILPVTGHAQSGPAAPVERARAVADSAAAAMLRDSVAGVVIAAYGNGAQLFASAYGFSNLAAQRPMRADEVLPIGSITKQFTAAAVLALVDDGRVALDHPAAKYLPSLGERFPSVTVRQLLNQTSGVGRYEMRFLARMPALADEVLEAVLEARPEFPPGERFSYNNANYLLLGRLIEAVTGTRYEQFLISRLFAPLEMRHTLPCTGSISDDDPVGYLVGTRRPMARPPLPAILTGGAGALCSTADDLARWSHALHTGGVLSPASYLTLTTPPPSGDRAGYAMGTVSGRVGVHRELWHNGALTSGFFAMLAHYPESAITVVVLANSFPVPVESAARAVARALLDAGGPN